MVDKMSGYKVLENSALWLWEIRNQRKEKGWVDEYANKEGILIMEEALYAILRAKTAIKKFQNNKDFNELIYNDIKRLIHYIKEEGFNGTPYLDLNSEFKIKADFIDSLSYFWSIIGAVYKENEIWGLFKEENQEIKNLILEKLNKMLRGAINVPVKGTNRKVKAITWVFEEDMEKILKMTSDRTRNVSVKFNPSAYFTYSLLSGLSDIYNLDFINNKLKENIKEFISNIINGVIDLKIEFRNYFMWNENLIDTFNPPSLLPTIYIFMSLLYAKYYFNLNINNSNIIENTKNYIIDKLNEFTEGDYDLSSMVNNPITNGNDFGSIFKDETFIFEALTALTLFTNFSENDQNIEDVKSLKRKIINKIINLYNIYNMSEITGFYSETVRKPAIYITSPAIDSLLGNVEDEKGYEDIIQEKLEDIKNVLFDIIKENKFDFNNILNFIIDFCLDNQNSFRRNLENYILRSTELTNKGPDYVNVQIRNLENILNLLRRNLPEDIKNSIRSNQGDYIDKIRNFRDKILEIDVNLDANSYKYKLIETLIEFCNNFKGVQNE
jgi:hypothetical protein